MSTAPLRRLQARAAYATSHNDNSTIFRAPATGEIVAWADVSGMIRTGPVDISLISPAARALLKTEELSPGVSLTEPAKVPAIPADEETLDHVDIRPMQFHDSTPREVMGSMDDSFFELTPWSDIFRMLGIILVGCIILACAGMWYLDRAIPVSQSAPVPAKVQSAPVEFNWIALDNPANWATWPDLPHVSRK